MAYFLPHSLGIQMPQVYKVFGRCKITGLIDFFFAPIRHIPRSLWLSHTMLYSIILRVCVCVISLLFLLKLCAFFFLMILFCLRLCVCFFLVCRTTNFYSQKRLSIQHQVHISSSITVYHKHLIAPSCIRSIVQSRHFFNFCIWNGYLWYFQSLRIFHAFLCACVSSYWLNDM